MVKLPNKYILLPIRCKTEAYIEIEDYIDKGILKEYNLRERLKESTDFRMSRLNIDIIGGYYSGEEADKCTIIDLANGVTIYTSMPIEVLDIVIRKAKHNIWNLWGILL